MRWVEHVSRMGRLRNAYGIVVEKSEGKGSFGRPRRRRKDNIKMKRKEIV
jgi:hypothetical protein